MLQDFVHVLLILPTAGYGALVTYNAIRSWREGDLQPWEFVAVLLAGGLILFASYLLWLGTTGGFQLLLLALLSLHSVMLNNEHGSPQTNWRTRLLVSLVLLVLAYLAIT